VSHKRSRARRFALQAIYQWQMTGNDLKNITDQFLEEQDVKRFDLDYFSDLLRGVAMNVDECDALIKPFITRPIEQIDPIERALLRLATFELKEKQEIPYRVVINEAIELAKKFGAEQGHRFINGVLDQVATEIRAVEVAAKKT